MVHVDLSDWFCGAASRACRARALKPSETTGEPRLPLRLKEISEHRPLIGWYRELRWQGGTRNQLNRRVTPWGSSRPQTSTAQGPVTLRRPSASESSEWPPRRRDRARLSPTVRGFEGWPWAPGPKVSPRHRSIASSTLSPGPRLRRSWYSAARRRRPPPRSGRPRRGARSVAAHGDDIHPATLAEAPAASTSGRWPRRCHSRPAGRHDSKRRADLFLHLTG